MKFNSTDEAKQFIEQRKEDLQSLLKYDLELLEKKKELVLMQFALEISKLENLEERLLVLEEGLSVEMENSE